MQRWARSVALAAFAASASAQANPTFVTVLSGVSPTVYEVDFIAGSLLEIATLDVPITAFDQEPGTGRLVGWADGATPGLYEIDARSGSTSLIAETTPGIVLDELFFTESGLLGVDLFTESYDVDPATGAMTPQLGSPNYDVTARALAPDGVGYVVFNHDRISSSSSGPIAELFDQGIDAWIADETTLYSVGRAGESISTIGSTSWNSGVTVSTWQRVESGLIQTSLEVPLGASGSLGPKPLGLALLPEAQTGWLMLAGFGCVARWSSRRAPPRRGAPTGLAITSILRRSSKTSPILPVRKLGA